MSVFATTAVLALTARLFYSTLSWSFKRAFDSNTDREKLSGCFIANGNRITNALSYLMQIEQLTENSRFRLESAELRRLSKILILIARAPLQFAHIIHPFPTYPAYRSSCPTRRANVTAKLRITTGKMHFHEHSDILSHAHLSARVACTRPR